MATPPVPPTPTPEGSSADLVSLIDPSRRRDIELLTSAYDRLKDSIKTLGFDEAIRQANDYFTRIKDGQEAAGDLTAASKALTEQIRVLNNASQEAIRILKEYEEASKTKTRAEEEAADKALDNLNLLTDINTALKENTINTVANTNSKVEDLRRAAEGLEAEKTAIEEIVELQEERARLETLLRGTSVSDYATIDRLNALITNLSVDISDLEERNNRIDQNRINILKVAEAKLQKELLDNKKKEAEYAIILNDYEEVRLESLKSTQKEMGGILDKLMGASSSTNKLGTAFLAMQQSVRGGKDGVAALTEAMSKGLAESFLNPTAAANRFFNLLNDKVIQSTLNFDKLRAETNKLTGGMGEGFTKIAYNQIGGGISEPALMSMSKYGVTLEGFSKTYGELSNKITGFNNLTDQQRKAVTENAAALELLGVSSETYSKLTNMMMGVTGKSAEEAGRQFNELAKDAAGLSVSISKYTSDFESSYKSLIGYGRDATQIFKELNGLAIAAKGNLTTADLVGLANKFNTFDAAAESVSKLNSVLGGTSVNLLDIMRADPSERMMMLKKAATDSNLEFDKLNVGYQRLLAEFFDNDISKAAAFFKADINEIRAEQDKSSASAQELEKRKLQSVEAQKKLTAALENFKITLTPVIDLTAKVANGIASMFSFKGGPFIAVIGLIALAFGGLQWAIGRVTIGITSAATAMATASKTMAADLQIVSAEMALINAQLAGIPAEVAAASTALATLRAERAALVTGGVGGAGGGAAVATGFGARARGFFGGPMGQLLVIGGLMYGASYLSEKIEKSDKEQKEQLEKSRNEAASGVLAGTTIPPAGSLEGTQTGNDMYLTNRNGFQQRYDVNADKDDVPVLMKQGGEFQKQINKVENNMLKTNSQVSTTYSEAQESYINNLVFKTRGGDTTSNMAAMNQNINNTTNTALATNQNISNMTNTTSGKQEIKVVIDYDGVRRLLGTALADDLMGTT